METLTELVLKTEYSGMIITPAIITRLAGGSHARRWGLVNRALKCNELIRLKRGMYILNPSLQVRTEDTTGRQKFLDFLCCFFGCSLVTEHWKSASLLSVISKPDIPVLTLLFLAVLVLVGRSVEFHNMFPS